MIDDKKLATVQRPMRGVHDPIEPVKYNNSFTE